MKVDLDALPRLGELFDRLRYGRHLCVDDGALYLALRADLDAYQAIFRSLGFDLVQHDRGFCYFRSDKELGKGATQLVVFFFVLVQAWGDAGLDIEATAFDPVGHRIAELPHFVCDSSRQCMAEAGVEGPEGLVEVVRRLERLGFAECTDGETFRFRTPAWRFFDLCLEVWEDTEASKKVQGDYE